MMDVIRTACPGCKRSLNVPADWAGRAVRCKHCGNALLVRATAAPAAARPPVPRAAPVPMAAPVPAPTWEPLPDGSMSDPVLPAPLPDAPRSNYVSAFDTRDKYRGRGQYRGPRKNGWVKGVVFGLLFLLVGGLGLFGAAKAGLFKKAGAGGGEGGGGGESPVAQKAGGGETTGGFPRRMLAISIHSYLYANPLHNGDSGYAIDESRRSGTDAAVRRLAERWRIPKDQLYHLTDAPSLAEKKARSAAAEKKEPAGEMKPAKGTAADMPAPKRLARSMPLRGVIEGTITQFLESSRAQDRIVLLFAGHAMEKDGKAYLVPIEGDLEELDSLIPLEWLYQQLGSCKAQEKIVIFDVCRFHPERGIERPDPGPMTEALETALHSPPAGVTVVTSCSKGEQSVELDYYNTRLSFDKPGVKGTGVDLHGSFFLSMLHAASIAGALSPDGKLPAPADEIPVERLTTWMREKLAEVVHSKFSDRTQTLKATIQKGPEVAYDPAEAVPARFEFPLPPPSAEPQAVAAIVREVQLPPVKAFREDAPPPSISDVMPFSKEALQDYLAGELKPGTEPNQFQKAVLNAVTGMRAMRNEGSGGELPEEFGGETTDAAKEELRKVQEVPARVEDDLQVLLDALDRVADQKEKQTKRWQVHHDYVAAQLKLRICYANQYNLALANVRGGKLPDLKPDQNGYRLTAETKLDKNTPANYKALFAEARQALTEIAKNNPRTPWAVLAKSDRTVAIGLRLSGGTVGTR